MYSVTAQEAQIQKARRQQGLAPSEGCRGERVLPLVASATSRHYPSLQQCLSLLCLHQPGACSSLSSPLCASCKDLGQGGLNQNSLIIPAKTLFPNKITFPGSRMWLYRFGGQHCNPLQRPGCPVPDRYRAPRTPWLRIHFFHLLSARAPHHCVCGFFCSLR